MFVFRHNGICCPGKEAPLASPNPKLVDRRVQRTRRALRDAFHTLMAERGWDDVSIQSICERANIGRSTFYLHYDSKEQLLEGGLDDLRQALRCRPAWTSEGAPMCCRSCAD
ncbi:TetR/AcrR family transcriptional regulator [Bradyrhizobium nanningense]